MFFSLLILITGVTIQPHSKVEIFTKEISGKVSGGSGVIIGKNRILTAFHVIQGVVSATASCGKKIIDTRPIAKYEKIDLAVIEFTEDCNIEPIQLAKSNPTLASDIYIIGCPGDMCFIVTKGIVSGYNYNEATEAPQMWSDARVWHGNSGGPAINPEGELVGILVSMRYFSTIDIHNKEINVNSQNYACMVPVSAIKSFLNKVDELK